MGNLNIMIINTLFRYILFVLVCISYTSAYAGVYKWVDENGQVHYGEHPDGSSAERITIRKNETTKPRAIKKVEENSAENMGDSAENKSNGGDESENIPKKPEAPKVSKKEKRRLCKEAKGDVASISSRGRMRERTKNGEYVVLSEQQRQQRLSAARKKQRKNCR